MADNKPKVTFVSFRASLPAATSPITPVRVPLAPVSRSLVELHLFFYAAAAPDISKSGWRMRRTGGQQILPDNGSAESAALVAAFGPMEADWAPLPVSSMKMKMEGRELSGPPFNLIFEFYNITASAYQVGGILVTTEPRHTMHDLVVALTQEQKKAAAIPTKNLNESSDPEGIGEDHSQRP